MSRVKKLCVLSVSVSLSLVLSFLESLIPPLVAVPGVKIGLANVVTVFILYTLGAPSAALVSLVRVLLSALLFGSAVSFWYSLSGAALSLLLMSLAKSTRLFSSVGVSIVGGVAHNVGQTLAAMAILESAAIAVYLGPLLVSGVLAGIAVGAAAGVLNLRLGKRLFK